LNDIETELTAGMRERVARLTPPRDVLEAATRRHRRRTLARRGGYAAGVFALAGVLASGVTWTVERGPDEDRPAVAAQPPELALAAAVTASQGTSYRIRVTIGSGDPSPRTREGALDPVTATGYLRYPFDDGSGRYHEDRLVDGTWYVGGSTDDESTFKQMPGRRTRLDFGDTLHGVAGASADPNELLEALRERRALIRRTAADAYQFEIVLREDATVHERLSVSGDVKLDTDGRLASIVYETRHQAMKGSEPVDGRVSTAIELYDYGVAVSVRRPANVVMVRTWARG
jgi:hypothetical protein